MKKYNELTETQKELLKVNVVVENKNAQYTCALNKEFFHKVVLEYQVNAEESLINILKESEPYFKNIEKEYMEKMVETLLKEGVVWNYKNYINFLYEFAY